MAAVNLNVKTVQHMSSLFIITIVTCLHITSTAQVSNASFEKNITITARSIRIDSLLRSFSRQTGIEFSFSTNKISPSQLLTVPKQDQTLSQWLTTLRQSTGVRHKVVGNHIILFENSGPTLTAPKKNPSTGGSKTAPAKATGNPGQPSPTRVTILIDSSLPQKDSGVQQPNAQKTGASIAPGQVTPSTPATVVTGTAQSLTQAKTATLASKKAALPPSSTNPPKPIPSRRENKQEAPADGPADEAFQLIAGYSRHGSGDMDGIVFGADYTRYLSHAFSLNINIRGTINYDKDDYSYTNPTTHIRTDASVPFTTAGAQVGINAQLSALRSRHHEIMFSLGGFGRYQSASPDGYSVTSPQTSGNPEFIFNFYNWNKQNTVSAGLLLQLHYNFTFNNNLMLGIKGGIQTDTEGDLIPQAALSVGKRF
jgi:hypothetical protein